MNTLTRFRTLSCSNSVTYFLIIVSALVNISCTQSLEKRPSPLRSDSTKVGINMVRIEYSSPSVRGRKIFGKGDSYLEQYGEIWRTGANDATVFSTNVDIKIDTLDLPKGKYAFFTIPDKNSWEIIFNKEWDQWGSYYHQDSLNVLRLNVKSKFFDTSEEQMRLYFERDSLKFRWEKVGWGLPINLILPHY